MLVAQLAEQFTGNEVDQRIFQCPGRETHPATPAQAGLAEYIAFTQPVEQLAIAPIDLYRAAANIVQLGKLLILFQDRRAGLEVTHLRVSGKVVQNVVRQFIKGGEATEMVANLDQFDLHGQLSAGGLKDSVMPLRRLCPDGATGSGRSAIETGAVSLRLAQQCRPGQIGTRALGDLAHAFNRAVENTLWNRNQLTAAGLRTDLDLAAALQGVHGEKGFGHIPTAG